MIFIVAQALTDVDTTYGTFGPLWPIKYECTGYEPSFKQCSESALSRCASPSTDSAGVRCTNIIGILNYLPMDTKLCHTSFISRESLYSWPVAIGWRANKQGRKTGVLPSWPVVTILQSG